MVAQQTIGGPAQVTTIESGDEGEVQQKMDRVPHSHMLMVFWNRLRRTLPVEDHQIGNLAKIP
jgi:hypothetical protein